MQRHPRVAFPLACALLACGEEVTIPDVEPDPAAGAAGRPIGEPCEREDQCATGRCVAIGPARVCTTPCDEGCPSGTTCAELGEDRLCAPDRGFPCVLCDTDADCLVPGQRCLAGAGGGAKACAPRCGSGNACPQGYACAEDGAELFCLADTVCTCDAAHEGFRSPCLGAAGAFGACWGTRTCLGARWEECVAPDPTQETCDGLDNDCDGVVDNFEDPDEPANDTCAAAADLGSFPDLAPAGSSTLVVRGLAGAEDVDWYRFDAPDDDDVAAGGDRFHVIVSIAGEMRFDVIRVAGGEDGCAAEPVATAADRYEYDLTGAAGTGDPDECPCGPGGGPACSDSSARFYVRVYALAELSCGGYTLAVENGVAACAP